jgi:hypothetical protein
MAFLYKALTGVWDRTVNGSPPSSPSGGTKIQNPSLKPKKKSVLGSTFDSDSSSSEDHSYDSDCEICRDEIIKDREDEKRFKDLFNDEELMKRYLEFGKTYDNDTFYQESFNLIDLNARQANQKKGLAKKQIYADKCFYFVHPSISALEYSNNIFLVYGCLPTRAYQVFQTQQQKRIQYINTLQEEFKTKYINGENDDDDESTTELQDVKKMNNAESTTPILQETDEETRSTDDVKSRLDNLHMFAKRDHYIGFVYTSKIHDPEAKNKHKKHGKKAKESTKTKNQNQDKATSHDSNQPKPLDTKKDKPSINTTLKDTTCKSQEVSLFILREKALSTTDPTSVSPWSSAIIIVKSGQGCIGFNISSEKEGAYLNHVSLDVIIDQLHSLGLLKHIYGQKLEESTFTNIPLRTDGDELRHRGSASYAPVTPNSHPSNLSPVPLLFSQKQSVDQDGEPVPPIIGAPTVTQKDREQKNQKALYITQCRKECNYSCVLIDDELTNGALKTHMWISQTLWREYMKSSTSIEYDGATNPNGKFNVYASRIENKCTTLTSTILSTLATIETQRLGRKGYLATLDLNLAQERTALFFKDKLGWNVHGPKPMIALLMELMSWEMQKYCFSGYSPKQVNLFKGLTEAGNFELFLNTTWATYTSTILSTVFEAGAHVRRYDSNMTEPNTSTSSTPEHHLRATNISQLVKGNDKYSAKIFIPQHTNSEVLFPNNYLHADKIYEGVSYLYSSSVSESEIGRNTNYYFVHKQVPGATLLTLL